jgi:polyprenyl P-hydroxybenzoate/phenylacrylic acid decarboxylase-like protein
MRRSEIEALADFHYPVGDIGGAIASGSFEADGMIVAPCSMKTLAAVALGYGDNLLTRSADVNLKERRRLVLMVRETPLNLAHLRNMVTITEMGGVIYPPVPAFYAKLASLEEMIDHTLGRVLDLFGIEHRGLVRRWQGLGQRSDPEKGNS